MIRDDRELMTLQAETLFVLNERRDIIRINEPEADRGPALFIGKTRLHTLVYFHQDLPSAVREEINGQIQSAIDIVKLIRILDRYKRVESMWAGPAYACRQDRFVSGDEHSVLIEASNRVCLEKHFPDIYRDYAAHLPIAAHLHDGIAVSVCFSARKSDFAAEAGVTTIEPFRGRGLAVSAVGAWCSEIVRRGLLPLYSTSWDNSRSQKVAEKLGFVQYGTDFHLTLEA